MNDQQRLDELEKDLASLKSAINRGSPIVRDTFELFRESARITWILAALFLSAGFGFQWVVFAYGSLEAVPPMTSLAGIGALVALFAFASFWKMRALGKVAHRPDGTTISFGTLFAQFFTGSLLHTQIALGVSLFATSVYLAVQNHPWYILPGFAFYCAVTCNHFASTADAPEFRVAGYLSAALGIGMLPLVEFAPFLCLGALIGGVLAAFALSFSISSGRTGRKGNDRRG